MGGGDFVPDWRDVRDALNEELDRTDTGLEVPEALDPADYHLLRLGLHLGVDHPEAARRVLALIEARTAEAAPEAVEEAGDARLRAATVPERTADDVALDFRSTLLARSAALPLPGRNERDLQPLFGWAATLTPAEILAIGHVVEEMLATGSPPDIKRGFGMAWTSGVRLPREELDGMIGAFAELQVMVGGVLVGHDLRAEATERRGGLSGLLNPWLSRSSGSEAQASAVIEAAGRTALYGLIALWNAWAGLRYRALVPRSTFELLVRPWRTAIGPLPDPGDASGSAATETSG